MSYLLVLFDGLLFRRSVLTHDGSIYHFVGARNEFLNSRDSLAVMIACALTSLVGRSTGSTPETS